MTSPTASIRVPVASRRSVWLAALLLFLAVIATASIIVGSSSKDNSSSSVRPAVTNSVRGPNEASRGAAAASATGATVGGPNEASRGAAAASAAGSQPSTGGSDQTPTTNRALRLGP
jgi:hypothetical protein